MPAPFEVVSYALDSLVQLALNGARASWQVGWEWCARLGIIRAGVRGNKPIHLAQKAINPSNAFVLPIQFAIGRSCKQSVHAGAVPAVALHHLVWRNDVAQALRHLRPTLDDHALGEQAFYRFIILYQDKV